MAKLFSNTDIKETWTAKNGATRNLLVVQNRTGVEIKYNEPIYCRIKYGTPVGHSKTYYIIIEPKEVNLDDEVVGLFLNRSYGFNPLDRSYEIYSANSIGGYGNSESKMGLYRVGVVIEVYSYKHRRGSEFWRLTDKGWERITDEFTNVFEEIK